MNVNNRYKLLIIFMWYWYMYIVIVVCLAYLYLSLLISLRILMRNKKNSLDSMSTLYLYPRYRSLFDSKQENACKIGVFF